LIRLLDAVRPLAAIQAEARSKFAKVAKILRMVQIEAGRLAVDAPLASRVRSGRQQP
jgi:hypothetical protein